jgi:GntR family transcriptional regulator
MLFRLNPAAGQPLYLQLMQQIRHAAEHGVLEPGDQLPGIRTLAEELVVSPTTVAKAYSELEHEGVLELRQGAGAFIARKRRGPSHVHRVQEATRHVRQLIADLRDDGLNEEEIRRIFEAELLYRSEVLNQR